MYSALTTCYGFFGIFQYHMAAKLFRVSYKEMKSVGNRGYSEIVYFTKSVVYFGYK